ncbi:hypothetical protein [Actinomadura roseirufa]|uniref:hypothetical protein n=1 Tax=Actinomadura roseirufa TaxID=2094049 RepID=UPI0013F1746D|nr:hypothetical protein [Actinomadura roseirufa]
MTIDPRRVVRRGTGRYTVLLVGLGAAGVAIGWLGPGGRAGPAARGAQPSPDGR